MVVLFLAITCGREPARPKGLFSPRRKKCQMPWGLVTGSDRREQKRSDQQDVADCPREERSSGDLKI